MAMNRAKLIKLRNNIQAYLNYLEKNNKVENLDALVNEHTSEELEKLKSELAEKFDKMTLPLPPLQDNTPIIKALEKLGSKMGPVTDRTDEIVTAISNIRFPEVNFPNTISVDNFPPQKIPNPVTNIKSTMVADDTGLLQDIVDAINSISIGTVTIDQGEVVQDFGVDASVAAGNTVVLASYTVPTAKVVTVSGVYGEGIDNGIFTLYVDGIKQWQARNAWTDRNVQGYLQYTATAGQNIEVKVTNIVNATRAYSGGFYGRQFDA